jgi:acyl-CoA thioester hydrolase
MEKMGLIVPILELESKYISPAYYEDELIVEVTFKNVNRVKMEFEYKVYREGENKPINIGKSVHGLVSKELRPMNVEKLFPEVYEKLVTAVKEA